MLPLHQGRIVVYQRKPRDSNSQVAVRPPVFKTGSSSGRMTSVLFKLRELESNQRPPGSEPDVTTISNYPAMFVVLKHSVRESHPTCELQRLTPRLRAGESALRESNPPRQVGSLEPLPLGQGHKLFQAEGEGVEPVKALVTLDRFRGGCRRQSACPSVKLRRQESNLRQDG